MVSRAVTTLNQLWANLPLRARAVALVLIPVPILFVAGVAMHRAEGDERNARALIEHTWDVRGDIQDAMVMLLDAEAAVREFVVRGDSDLLQPYLRSREVLPVLGEHLGALVEYEPMQSERWREAAMLIGQQMELLDTLCRNVTTAPATPERDSRSAVLLDQSRSASNTLRVKLTAMQMEEDRLLQIRMERAESARFRLFAVLVESAVIWLFFQMVATLLLASTISGQLRALDTNTQLSCEGLPQRPVHLDTREIHQLGARLQHAANLLISQEEQLHESEERFRILFKEAPIAYHEIDRDGVIGHVNLAECALLGVDRESLVGRYVWETVAPGSREAVRLKVLDRLAEKCPTTPYECDYQCSDRTLVAVEVHENLIRGARGQVVGIRSALLDITARKMVDMASRKVDQYARELKTKNEELLLALTTARDASATKGRFLAAMSHEFRTPLNGIIGLTELMFDGLVGPVSEEHVEYLGDILASSRHLLRLVNDVLDLAKVESGKMEFRAERVEIAPLLHEVRDVLKILADKKKISVTVTIDSGLKTVITDASRLKQVAYNYLSNAIKFTPERGSIQVRGSWDGGGLFRVEVEDTGLGIRDSDRSRLFVDFQQLDNAAQNQGSGLGLALTKRIVEGQGGTVGVRSAAGSGSIFYAILPSRSVEELEVSPDGADAQDAEAVFLSKIPTLPEIVRTV